MNYVDLILLLPLVYGLVRGLMKGLVNEVASLVSIIAGLYLAYHYSDLVEGWLIQQFGEDSNWLGIASYILIFLAVAIVVYLLARVLTRMINFMALGIINRIAGAAFGLAKIALIMLLIIYFLAPFLENMREDSEAWKNSEVYNLMTQYATEAGNWVTGFKEDNLNSTEEL